MKNYEERFKQAEKDLAEAADTVKFLKDTFCVIRLEQRAIHYLMDSGVKSLEISVSALINIFMAEIPHKNWNECLEILKERKPDWW